MKEFFEIMEKDYLKEDFSVKEWIVAGIVVPVVMIAIMAIAGWMDQLSGLWLVVVAAQTTGP